MPLKSDLVVRLTPELTKLVGAFTFPLRPEISKTLTLLTGTGLNQADRLYYSKPTIAGSATLTLDVATGGGLLDPFGDAVAMVKLKYILIVNELGPNTINLVRPASNGVPIYLAAGDGEPIHLGGLALKFWPTLAGIPVTAATADLIDIVNTAAGSVTPDILIGGTSA